VSLLEREFEIITNHQSLSHMPKQAHLTPWQVRAIEFPSQYHYTITYQPGDKNIPADALSQRVDHATNFTTIPTTDEQFFKNFIDLYPDDPALSLSYNLVQNKPEEVKNFSLINGILHRHGKICVPHGLSHTIYSMSSMTLLQQDIKKSVRPKKH
jgi:hypothetical protein